MDKPDLDNLTPDQQRIADHLESILKSINARGLHFVLVASSEDMLSHIGTTSQDRQAVAVRLHEIADEYAKNNA